MKTLALTGVTGFVGQNLAIHLLSQGHSLRVLIRQGKQLPQAVVEAAQSIDQIHTVTGDLYHHKALAELTANTETIIHCAASVRGACRQDFIKPNVDGTRNLLQACEAQQLSHIIFISSLAASQPQLSWYAESKALAETLVKQSTLTSTILRPPAIYGPEDKEMLPLFKLMANGFAIRVTPKNQRLSLLHVNDLCHAIKLLIPQKQDQLFTLHDGKPNGYDWQDLCTTIQAYTGRSITSLAIPGSILRMLAWTNLQISRAHGALPMLTPAKARELHWHDWSCSNTEITNAIDWVPEYSLEMGLKTLTLGH